ncbi:MAG TPA: acyltransferase [Anaerolineales bacterium]|nr:acyltransferase [Anaerolineae bacterium]HIP86833.1 acyltransferase [Anaerolineales bacterium]
METVSRAPDAAAVAAREGRLRYYIKGQSTGIGRYVVEQTLFALLRGLPGLVGIGLRALAYRLILHSDGLPVIEDHVRLARPANIHLGRNVYIDHGTYLHACPQGIFIGDETFVMHGSELHVYNFRDLPHAGIWIGRQCFIGESCLIRGQGGVRIGNEVLLAPRVQVLAVNHLFDDPAQPIIRQGISAEGIVVEDGAWVGAGAILLDGVRVGEGAVVGAGAVVTRDVLPRSVVVGVPARAVRRPADLIGRWGSWATHQ